MFALLLFPARDLIYCFHRRNGAQKCFRPDPPGAPGRTKGEPYLFSKLLSKRIEKTVHIIELIIAVIIIAGIGLGMVQLLRYFLLIVRAAPDTAYDLIQSFLGLALLLIVGAELIHMILYHSTEALLELILFVIARKMLIYSNNVVDLIFGTIAIALVFFTMKFLVDSGENGPGREGSHDLASLLHLIRRTQKKEDTEHETERHD